MDQVVLIFQTAAHAHQVGLNTGGNQLLVVHLAVGGAGGVQAAGAGIGHMGLNGGNLQVAHKGSGGFAPALYAKADNAAGTIG